MGRFSNPLDSICRAKQRGKTVAVAGPYVTSVPEEAREAGADFPIGVKHLGGNCGNKS